MPNTTPPPRSETQSAIATLDRLLFSGDGTGGLSQDWDLIVADPNRLDEFCDLYERDDGDADTRFALMMLILASLDDGIRDGEIAGDAGSVARIEHLLRQNFVLHFHTICYWALLGESDLKETFPVTPIMRRIWDENFREEYRQWLS